MNICSIENFVFMKLSLSLWDIWYIQIADIGKAKLLQTHRDVTFKVQKNDINLICLNNNLIVSKAAMTMYSLDDRKSRTSG